MVATVARLTLSLLLLTANVMALPSVSQNRAETTEHIFFDDEALAPRALPWHAPWFTRGAIELIKRGAVLMGFAKHDPLTVATTSQPAAVPVGKFGQRIGPLSRSARGLVAQLKTALEQESVTVDHSGLIANTIVRLQPASLDRLVSWKVITDKQKELILRQEPLIDVDAKNLAQSLKFIEQSYNEFTPIQQTYFLARMVPIEVIEKIQSDTRASLSEIAEAAERWGDFDERIYRAKSVVEIIAPAVGGNANAWDIVIRHGIDHAVEFSQFAASLVPRIAPLLGGPRKSWKVLIRYGTQNSIISAIHVTTRAIFYQLGSTTLISEMTGLEIVLIEKALHAPRSLDQSEVQMAYDRLLTVPRVNSLSPDSVVRAVEASISMFGNRLTARRAKVHHSTPARSLASPVRLRTIQKLNDATIEKMPSAKTDGAIGKGSALTMIDRITLDPPDAFESASIQHGINAMISVSKRKSLLDSDRKDWLEVIAHLKQLNRDPSRRSLGMFDVIAFGPENYLAGFGQTHRVGLAREVVKAIGTDPKMMADYLYHEGKASLSGETPEEHKNRYEGIQRRLLGDNKLKVVIRNVLNENQPSERQMDAARRVIEYLMEITRRAPDREGSPLVAVKKAILAYQKWYLGTTATAPVITDSPDSMTAELLSRVADFGQSKEYLPNDAAVARCQLVIKAFFLPDVYSVIGPQKSDQSHVTNLALFLLEDTSSPAAEPISNISNVDVVLNQTEEEVTAWNTLFGNLSREFSVLGDADMATIRQRSVELLDAEWALTKYHLQIPDATPVAEIAVDPFALKAMERLVDEMNANSQAVSRAIAVLQKEKPEQYLFKDFSVNRLWDDRDLPLEEKLRRTVGLLQVTDSDVPAVLHFWAQLARQTSQQRWLVLAAARRTNAQYRRAVTWTLMHQFPNVKAFRVYRGIDSLVYTGRQLISAEPAHLSVSREIATSFAGSVGQVLEVVVPLVSVIDLNLDEEEDREMIIAPGVYPMQPKAIRQIRRRMPAKAITSAA